MFESTKWQLSERAGLVVVLLSIPLFFLDWHYQKTIGEPAGRVGVNALAHLILFLAAVKRRAEVSQAIGKVRMASGGTRLVLSREREILDRFRSALGADGTQLALLILRAGRGPL